MSFQSSGGGTGMKTNRIPNPKPCKFCFREGKTIFPKIKHLNSGTHAGYWLVACPKCKTGVIGNLQDAIEEWNYEKIPVEIYGGRLLRIIG